MPDGRRPTAKVAEQRVFSLMYSAQYPYGPEDHRSRLRRIVEYARMNNYEPDVSEWKEGRLYLRCTRHHYRHLVVFDQRGFLLSATCIGTSAPGLVPAPVVDLAAASDGDLIPSYEARRPLADRFLDAVGRWLPRRRRRDLTGDIGEDLAELRAQGWGEVSLIFHVMRQVTWMVLVRLPDVARWWRRIKGR